jgi:hypothetical protein
MSDHQKNAPWTTASELNFIDGMGVPTGKRQERPLIADRRTLLKNYLAGLDRRRNWDRIDPVEVRAHALRALAALDLAGAP